MTQFDDRARAFEKKFEMEEELRFKISSRAAKLLGVWAAQQMGLSGAEADSYANSVLEADLTKPRHAALVNKIEQDFKARSVNMPRQHIAEELEAHIMRVRENMLEE